MSSIVKVSDRDDNPDNILGYIEDYNNLIWTRRYSEVGDFEIAIPKRNESSKLIQKDRILSITDSEEDMVIESIKHSDGLVTASGRTTTCFMERRRIMVMAPSYAEFNHMIYELVRRNAGAEQTPSNRRLTNWDVSYGHPDGFVQPKEFDRPAFGDNLLDGIESMTSVHDLGLKTVRSSNQIPKGPYDWSYRFYIYNGVNRYEQEGLILTKETGGLLNIEKIDTEVGSSNAVYTFLPKIDESGSDYIKLVHRNPSLAKVGFERREQFVDASSIRDIPGYVETPDIRDKFLDMRAKQVLYDTRPDTLFSFDLMTNPAISLGRDYFLGDILMYSDEDGESSMYRVAEEIFASNGERIIRYPTLSEIH